MNAHTQAISRYVIEIDKIYRAGNATEHSYRHILITLLENLTNGLSITNEPKHIECGAPDYIITRGGIPVGYIEAKDIPVGLYNKLNKEQFDRYRQSLNNLIITDYLTFRFYVDGEYRLSVTIAHESKGAIVPEKDQYDAFIELVNQFVSYSGKTISASGSLAAIMADKSKLLAAVIHNALKDKSDSNTLTGQYEGFRKILLHNLGTAEFSDIYAQTLAYGLFAARLNQTDGQPFTRIIAAHLIPKSNPFLRRFFNYIAGVDLDSRIVWIVDALADLFNCVAVEDIKKEFLQANQDPYIHFYETFLAKYNPELRETHGVYYTPLPVVKFIVRAVDDILKTEFNIKAGLADHSKLKDADGFHKVQILDPAAGTGTFLAEVIDKIREHFAGNKGAWQEYCADHLIPRVNGFEILMASYAMAHFKLDMTLRETGFHWDEGRDCESSRLHIYLTNTLDEAPEGVPELFMAQWLAREAEEARRVKRDVPVMVVMGNPPYNVSTQNKNDWINGLIAEYKQGLNEKKLNLDDDYIKFIRYGQYLIEKTQNGILAYISNNSFIDGITHRKMRETLLKSFDKIFIFDMHGNSRRRETTLDGKSDGNVFDIQQGVSINIFIKTSEKTGLAKVYHRGLSGKREEKYRFLMEHDIFSLKWQELHPEAPYYFFVPKNFDNQHEYEKGFSVTELFTVYNNAIKTDRDALFIDIDREILEIRMQKLLSGKYDERFTEDYKVKDSSSYKLIKLISNNQFEKSNISIIQYRPFDYQYIYYKQGLTSRPAFSVMKHFKHDNISLLTCRQQSTIGFQHIFVSKTFSEVGTVSSKPGETTYVFPLYLCPQTGDLDETKERQPNLNNEIVQAIAQKTELQFANEKTDGGKTFAPIDILGYIYAVLHSPAYRIKYKELLKIDFPRIPYPESAEQFCRLASLGSVLRKLHLMEDVSPANDKASFPIAGSNEISTLKYEKGKVFINKTQYFDNVSLESWEFYIGGYQPAQKWLKDRKGRTLVFDEIEHYRKIITIQSLTADLQRQIDLERPAAL